MVRKSSNYIQQPAIRQLHKNNCCYSRSHITKTLISSQNPNFFTMKPATSQKTTKKFVKETRNWLDLPRDILILIFIKLGTVDVLHTAENVCSLWKKICKEPQLFRCIDMRNHWHVFSGSFMRLWYNHMARKALDRCSNGELVEFSLEYLGTDELIRLVIAKSRSSLRCLRFANSTDISGESLVDIAAANPMLEEIDLPLCYFDAETIGKVGRSCQHLKSFRMTNLVGKIGKMEESYIPYYNYDFNVGAYAVANNMPGLRRLCLLGNKMDNKGLQAILDKCPHLEYLDLRRCLRIDLEGDVLIKKCVEKVRNLRLPNDSTDDYEFRVGDEDGYTPDESESAAILQWERNVEERAAYLLG